MKIKISHNVYETYCLHLQKGTKDMIRKIVSIIFWGVKSKVEGEKIKKIIRGYIYVRLITSIILILKSIIMFLEPRQDFIIVGIWSEVICWIMRVWYITRIVSVIVYITKKKGHQKKLTYVDFYRSAIIDICMINGFVKAIDFYCIVDGSLRIIWGIALLILITSVSYIFGVKEMCRIKNRK